MTRTRSPPIAFAIVVGALIFSLRNWRCPACDKDKVQVELVERVGRGPMIQVIEDMSADDRADLVQALSEPTRDAILPLLAQAERNEIKRLPEREKLVLSLYYDEGLTLSEIGDVIGVTESRVSQIHTKSVLHLRSRMSAAGVG